MVGYHFRDLQFGRRSLGGNKGDVMDIGVLRTTIMEQDNGLMAIYTTDGLY
jgi:hypothetical protein